MNTITITINYVKDLKLFTFNDGKNIGIDITTDVQKGDLVIWKLGEFSELASIDKIIDSSKIDIFKPDPKKNDDGSWQAIVTASAPALEKYEVICSVKDFSKKQDPKIQIH